MKIRSLERLEPVTDTNIRTLVVDDSPFMLKILSQVLEQTKNFELVGSATNGSQALRYVSMLSPELVLMDAHMPRLNGIQATRYIKQCEHPPIVIMITSDESEDTKANAAQAGADAFIIKDENLRHELMSALAELFGPNRPSRANIGNSQLEGSRASNQFAELSLCSR